MTSIRVNTLKEKLYYNSSKSIHRPLYFCTTYRLYSRNFFPAISTYFHPDTANNFKWFASRQQRIEEKYTLCILSAVYIATFFLPLSDFLNPFSFVYYKHYIDYSAFFYGLRVLMEPVVSCFLSQSLVLFR